MQDITLHHTKHY